MSLGNMIHGKDGHHLDNLIQSLPCFSFTISDPFTLMLPTLLVWLIKFLFSTLKNCPQFHLVTRKQLFPFQSKLYSQNGMETITASRLVLYLLNEKRCSHKSQYLDQTLFMQNNYQEHVLIQYAERNGIGNTTY